MITAAPTTIGETGSVSTGPMLALNGISRKFQKVRDAPGPPPRRTNARRALPPPGIRHALQPSYFSLSSVSLANFSDSACLPAE